MSTAIKTILQLRGAISSANGLAEGLLDNPLEQAERTFCDVWATNPNAVSLDPDAVAPGINARCKPYYDDIGAEPPAGAPPLFQGGQCPVQYDVTVDSTLIREVSGRPPFDSTSTVRGLGPVSGVQVRESRDGAPAGRFESAIVVSFADAERTAGATFVDDGNTGYVINDVSVQRVDGQSDNCGDPDDGPIQPTPNYPRPPSIGSDGTITPSPQTGGPPISIEIRNDIDGDEYYEITGPGFEYIRGPGFEDPNVPEGVPPAVEGPPIQPTGDGGEITDDVSPEEEGQGLETIGYAWDLVNYPDNAGIVQDTEPDVFFTPLGNVQLVYDIDGKNRFSDNLPIRTASGSIFRSDASLKIRSVRFNKRPDVGSIILTPIRRVKENAN